MNIKFKRFLRMALCLLLCAAFFTGGVFAAGKLQKRTITVYSGVDIYVDDARLDARDANGNPVEVFIYNGTTYLPCALLARRSARRCSGKQRPVQSISASIRATSRRLAG